VVQKGAKLRWNSSPDSALTLRISRRRSSPQHLAGAYFRRKGAGQSACARYISPLPPSRAGRPTGERHRPTTNDWLLHPVTLSDSDITGPHVSVIGSNSSCKELMRGSTSCADLEFLVSVCQRLSVDDRETNRKNNQRNTGLVGVANGAAIRQHHGGGNSSARFSHREESPRFYEDSESAYPVNRHYTESLMPTPPKIRVMISFFVRHRIKSEQSAGSTSMPAVTAPHSTDHADVEHHGQTLRLKQYSFGPIHLLLEDLQGSPCPPLSPESLPT
jgi:hypothetical protein